MRHDLTYVDVVYGSPLTFTWKLWARCLVVLALLDADGLRQLVVAGGDLVDDDPPLAVRVERPGNVVNIMGGIATKTCGTIGTEMILDW